MKPRAALALLQPAQIMPGGVWADLGAGTGTFTRALAELLGPEGCVYAVDRDARALAELARQPPASRSARIVTVTADFTEPFDLPGSAPETIDGLLLANALHFVRNAEQVLTGLTHWLNRSGRVVLVEYERRAASRWVPYPIGPDQLERLARSAGLRSPRVVARTPSAFGGDLYVAVAERFAN